MIAAAEKEWPKTIMLAERLIELSLDRRFARDAPMLEREGRRLLRCGREGWILRRWCGRPCCPRCQAREAKRRRRELERARDPPTHSIRLSVGSDDLDRGARALRDCFAPLRRRRIWVDAIAGGRAYVEAKPARAGATRRWNVHVHIAASALQDGALGALRSELRRVWTDLIWWRGLRGSTWIGRYRANWARRRGGRGRLSCGAAYHAKRARSELLEWTDDQVVDWVRWAPRKRMVITFGNWRKSHGR